jgi:hypothetical protein
MVYTAEVYYVMCVWGELPFPEAYGFTDAKYPVKNREVAWLYSSTCPQLLPKIQKLN